MNYKKLVPEDSFIGQYLEYMSVVETAEAYDFWCAMWGIGVECGRNVFVDRPNSPVYLNWYIILAAESGTTRKSTAVSSITRLLDGDRHMLLTGKTSPEGLEQLLHKQFDSTGKSAIAISVSELVTILGKEGYMTSMPGLLTDLYDSPSERKKPSTSRTKAVIMENIYVNFLSASTPSWLVTAINPSVIEGGFTSRVIFVVEDARKRSIAWPQPRKGTDTDRLRGLLSDTGRCAQDIGPIAISSGGLRKFTRWYNSRATHNDPFLSSFEAREDDHTLRCAACLCINDGTLEIQATHITTAIKIIASAKQRANGLFGGNFSTNARLANAVSRVRELVIEVGADAIKHSVLQRKMQHMIDAKELKVLMKVMHESNLIQIFNMPTGGTMYRATKSIEQFGVTSEVLAKLNL
jgi:hypothetical protein